MNITVVGGGNIGMLCAVHCAAKGHNVTIYTSKYKLYKNKLKIVDAKDTELLNGEISCATNNPQIAFSDADLIFVTLPAFCADSITANVINYAKKHPPIGFIPGTGGVEFIFSKYDGDIFGLQRVPAIARIKTQGEEVCATGYKNELYVSAMNSNNVEKYRAILFEIFNIPCISIKNYFNITLTPSNPILHTTRLFSLFSNYHDDTKYEKIPLFYEEWDEKASELMFACDSELQQICKSYKNFDLNTVKSLKIYYESDTPFELTQKISGIKAFQNILSPMIKTDGGYIPDFNSRYFTSDFPYGLYIIKQAGEFTNCSTPTINTIWNWYKKLQPNTKCFEFAEYGINSAKDIIDFYDS